MTAAECPDLICACGHHAQLHTPTGRVDDTDQRGSGPCTVGAWGWPCECPEFVEATR